MISLFALLPTIVLMLYPFTCFQKMLQIFPLRWNIILHTFMDTFYGCYKDGTEPGTRDCRWFFSLFMVIRILSFVVGGLMFNSTAFLIIAGLLVAFSILMFTIQPFKSTMTDYCETNATFMLLLALFYTCIIGRDMAGSRNHENIEPFQILIAVSSLIPLCYNYLSLMWIFKRRRFSLELVQRLRAWRHGYDLTPIAQTENYNCY